MSVKILDHGYLKFVEAWGSDERIIEAARMSTSKGFLGWGDWKDCEPCAGTGRVMGNIARTPEARYALLVPCPNCDAKGGSGTKGDEKLLRFLYENKHSTPFEMAGLTIEVQAPIFVFREWHRHRTQSYNEMSARYTPLPDVNYLPSIERCLVNSKTNKQAGTVSDADELTEEAAADLLAEESDLLVMIEDLYQRKLKAGFPKELARTHLNVSRYSRMMASTNLRNWLAFLTLRQAPQAQWEIRQYADAVAGLIAEQFPRTHALFVEGRS